MEAVPWGTWGMIVFYVLPWFIIGVIVGFAFGMRHASKVFQKAIDAHKEE